MESNRKWINFQCPKTTNQWEMANMDRPDRPNLNESKLNNVIDYPTIQLHILNSVHGNWFSSSSSSSSSSFFRFIYWLVGRPERPTTAHNLTDTLYLSRHLPTHKREIEIGIETETERNGMFLNSLGYWINQWENEWITGPKCASYGSTKYLDPHRPHRRSLHFFPSYHLPCYSWLQYVTKEFNF